MTYQEKLRDIKLGLLPRECVPKEKKQIPRLSKRKLEENAAKKNKDKKEDEYYEYWMKHAYPKCDNCGRVARWLLEEKYATIWRACQAHVLPKRKSMFPSLANNLKNHLVLFPSWGGLLCGCHGWFDSNWYNASTMDVWPKAVEIFKQLYSFIPPHELKNTPEILLKELP
jgi:hypothetical protein